MQDEAKIQALLQSNTPENQKIAIQLIQSQWNFDIEKAYNYAIDFYCKKNDREFFLYLGDKTISYVIDHYQESERRWDAILTFRMEQDNIVKREEPFIVTNIGEHDANEILKNYIWNIKTHFKQLLPTISQD